MTPPAKRRRTRNGPSLLTSKEALEMLEKLGDLWRLLEDGKLPGQIKRLLEALSPSQRDEYFRKDLRGRKLLSQVCYRSKFAEVRYVLETLGLDNLRPSISKTTARLRLCPLLSALAADPPSVEIVRYLAEHLWPVQPEAFILWGQCRINRRHLAALLEPLVRYGRNAIPCVYELFTVLGDAPCTRLLSPCLDRRSNHLELLRGVVPFTRDDIRFAAEQGLGAILGQLIEDNDEISPNEIADFYELCEFSRYRRVATLLTKLDFFRKSLQYGRSSEARLRLAFGRWKQFETLDDLKRLERQIADGDYLETTHQVLLAAAKAGIPKDRINVNTLRGVNTLRHLLEIKSFVMTSGFFGGDGQDFLRNVAARSETIFRCGLYPEMTLLPSLYECTNEMFAKDEVLPPLASAIQNYLRRGISDSKLTHQINGVKKRRDQILFLAVYAYQVQDDREGYGVSLPKGLSLIARLLRTGAGLLVLPGHAKSTLRYILASEIPLSQPFVETLRPHLCCRLDLTPEEASLFGMNLDESSPLPLRCLAAISCQRFPRSILEKTLPDGLVHLAECHPRNCHVARNAN
ncbi:hypothetical protein BIW11_09382 [Tropilaelaps mercedesae]|uniref:Uncharacterized protein n=1 Tax=Tropilaelaps mercedesae TaxID=418985 RepID=A0A1V9XKI6_9ACAR|nr:hypothetical protein BIW11_09382 [Tropilaelaps mercedesae]OQR73990.1 hypothetical protein BIW11_09382 [Tropilaelaps mercedesae]